jgi:hypothetical protein
MLRVCAQEYRCTENALEGCNQTAILRAALLQAEDVQHFGCASQCDRLRLLSHGECREKNGHEPVLAPRYAVLGMASDLKNELAVSAFVDQSAFGRALDRNATKDKGS